jgi:hypothetical protein
MKFSIESRSATAWLQRVDAASLQSHCCSAIKTGADDLARIAQKHRSKLHQNAALVRVLGCPIHARHAMPAQFVRSRSLLSEDPGSAATKNRSSAVTLRLGEPGRKPIPIHCRRSCDIARQTAMGAYGLIE